MTKPLIETEADVFDALASIISAKRDPVNDNQPVLEILKKMADHYTNQVRGGYVASIGWDGMARRIGCLAIEAIGGEQFSRGAEPFATLLMSKHRAYGVQPILRWGELGLLVKITLKIDRLVNLAKTGASENDESVTDTLTDIVGYCVLMIRFRSIYASKIV